MSPLFYSRRQQFFREWRVLWALCSTDILLGCMYVLSSFYFFRMVGNSQVYNVIMPFFMASFVAAYLTYRISGSQVRGNTRSYFTSLPRERKVVWQAHSAFVLCIVLGLEAIIAIGVAVKLGGAGLTPVYRLHPELMALPFVAVTSMFLGLYLRYTKWVIVLIIIVVLASLMGAIFWALDGFWEDPEALNNYHPSRGYELSYQCSIAFGMMILSVVIHHMARKRCMNREVGELL